MYPRCAQPSQRGFAAHVGNRRIADYTIACHHLAQVISAEGDNGITSGNRAHNDMLGTGNIPTTYIFSLLSYKIHTAWIDAYSPNLDNSSTLR